MPILLTPALKPGMILKRAVRNLHGQLILAPGTVLQDKHLWVLKSWGIREVEIEASSDSPGCESGLASPDRAMERVREELLPLFKHQDLAHPAVAELLNACILLKSGQKL